MKTNSPANVQIDVQEKQIVIRFPNQSSVRFSREVPGIQCAGYAPTYTRKGWLWSAYNNALIAEKIELDGDYSLELFQEIWLLLQTALLKGLPS